MGFKFERLEVWRLALDYVDRAYEVAEQLPDGERYNLQSQLRRAATSIGLNIAEGSTSQSDMEQARFLSLASRSLVETVACLHLIRRRAYAVDVALVDATYRAAEKLFAKLQAFIRVLRRNS